MKEVIKKTVHKTVDTVRGRELINEKPESKILLSEPEEVSSDEAENQEENKSLSQRIEDLVNEMERNNHLIAKIYSLRSAFFRGLLQGLGIIIGSTILAGALYSMTVQLFGNDFLRDVVLDNVIEKYNQKK
jgi:hypothetical protein